MDTGPAASRIPGSNEDNNNRHLPRRDSSYRIPDIQRVLGLKTP